MALFNTLKQILTPYANKINLHSEEIEEIQSDVSEVTADLGAINPLIDAQTYDVSDGEHRGHFINKNALITSTTGTFAYSAPIAVSKNKEYKFTASGTTLIAAICECNSNGNERSVKFVYSTANTEETFTYVPAQDGYIVLSYNYSAQYTLKYHDVNFKNVNHYAAEIEKISDRNENLINFSDVVIGKNWALANASDRAIINIPVNPLTEYIFEFSHNSNFFNLIAVEKTSAVSTNAVRSTDLSNGGTVTLKTQFSTTCICIQFASRNTITSDIFQNYDAVVVEGNCEITAVDRVLRSERFWSGKRLVWLGTSIPAAGKYDVNNKASYPLMVGKRLGATVYNEAVGSSALHCKEPNRISESNPYGFMSNFEAVSRCITNSLDEMEWIINHYNDSAVFTKNVPSSLSDADKEFIRSCSWEIKLQKYFNANDFPDAWIIDHGHNDIPSEASEATYTEKSEVAGIQHDGYYQAGNFVSSSASSYIEYDVTNELFVWISGTIGSFYDIYDLFDADGNNIGYSRNVSQAQISGLKVNVAYATTLRVSNPNNLINTIVVNKLKYPMYNSLYSYQGGFDFMVNKIKEYNPRARIIMIGEYENQKYPAISENQIIASERWEFPLYRQWENLGWSQQYLKVDGKYVTYLSYFIPDNLHPHSDTTGWALEQIANNISAWLKTIT